MTPKDIHNALVITLTILVVTAQGEEDDCTVTIQNGTIIGATGDTFDPTKKVCSYLGIPFAAPPVGPLRFQAPLPATGWENNLNATTFQNWCPQPGNPPPGIIISEDCLYLNVYQPKMENISDSNLPVMVWIHGGGFTNGASLPFYTPHRLLANDDVILVVIHYRVGLFGFMSTGDDVCPGNAGLKDQSLSLRWVKENIRAFGGNPEQVTIFGESAGGSSVIYQLVSKLNKGLIHRAIAQSSYELRTMDPNPFESAQLMARRLNCQDTVTSQEIINCLRGLTWEEIIQEQEEASTEAYFNLTFPYGTVTPVVEPDLPGAFITRDPMDIIKDGEVDTSIPVMLGANKHEGSYILASLYLSSIGLRGLDQDPEYMRNQIVPDLLNFFRIRGDEANRAVASSVEMAYVGGVNRSSWNESMPGLVDMLTVFYFKSSVLETAELLSNRGTTVYLYSFEHHSLNSVWETVFGFESAGVPVEHGITHGDDLMYMFNVPFEFNWEDQSFSDVMCDLWINFAGTGNPTPSPSERYENWPTYNRIEELYIKLNGTPTVQSGYRNSWRANGFRWE